MLVDNPGERILIKICQMKCDFYDSGFEHFTDRPDGQHRILWKR